MFFATVTWKHFKHSICSHMWLVVAILEGITLISYLVAFNHLFPFTKTCHLLTVTLSILSFIAVLEDFTVDKLIGLLVEGNITSLWKQSNVKPQYSEELSSVTIKHHQTHEEASDHEWEVKKTEQWKTRTVCMDRKEIDGLYRYNVKSLFRKCLKK